MKLPSGREISVDSLMDVAEMLATENFYLDSEADAEEEIRDQLRNPSFSLSGTELPFEDDNDITAVFNAVARAAGLLSEALYGAMKNSSPMARLVIGQREQV